MIRIVALFVLLLAQTAVADNTSAELILRGGTVYSLDTQGSRHSAIAVSGSRIIALGTEADINLLMNDETEVIELDGRVVFPGFIDTHIHTMDTLPLLNGVMLSPGQTADEVLEAIAEHAANFPSQNPVLGSGFLARAFGINGPTAAQLDAVVPHRPALIIDEGGHTAWANSLALANAAISAQTPDPVPGAHFFQRDQLGNPTGWLVEGAAIEPVKGALGVVSENLGKLDRIRDKNGKINQPPHMIGRDIVYFISYLQIRMGFRLSEVFYSYRNRDVYNDFHIPNYPNEMASYWEKSEDGWIIHIKKSKNKDRSVPFTDTIRSWVMPPSEELLKVSKCVLDKKGNPLYWDTPFVDVCMELFPNSYYLFPSPNHKESPNSKRSKTYYMNEFKIEMVLKNGWDKFGINSSHDLRRFFVSHSITNTELTPFQISQITGHNIVTMEKFYIRDNMKEKFNHFKKITQQDLLKIKPSKNKD